MKRQLLLLTLITTTLLKFSYGQEKTENLQINWPEEYKWKIGSNQEDKSVHMMELVPGNETVEKWTIIGTMLSIKGAENVPMDAVMNMTFDQAKIGAPKAKLTVVEKDEKALHPWILFKIEAPNFKDDKNPESQLYYVVQGDQSLYSNFVAIKEKVLTDEFVEKWTKVFKASEIVESE
jgi:hypothetical protein